MNSGDIENLVLEIIGQVRLGHRVEDSRVECKSTWLEAKIAARKIAAHANSACGENILWIFGIDDGAKTICGVGNLDLANWISQLNKEFDGTAPALVADRNIPYEFVNVVALLFESNQAPYVTKIAGSDKLEVPWREGTRTKSAGRGELIRIFSVLRAKGLIETNDELFQATPAIRILASEKPPNWQLLLSVELLRSYLERCKQRKEENDLGFNFQKTNVVGKQEFVNLMASKASDLHTLINIVQSILQNQLPSYSDMEAAAVSNMVKRLIQGCDQLFEFEREMQGIAPPILKEEYAKVVSGMVHIPEAIVTLIDVIEKSIQKSQKLVVPEKPLFIFPVISSDKVTEFTRMLGKVQEFYNPSTSRDGIKAVK